MILSILDQLSNTKSTNDKLEILKNNENNILLKEIFRMTYTKTMTYGMKKVLHLPESYTVSDEEKLSLESMCNFIKDKLQTREFSGNKAQERMSYYLGYMTENDATVVQRILDRDLNCGAGATLANKVWKNLIPKQPQMLCQPMNQKTLSRIKYPAFSQMKADGARCFMEVEYFPSSDEFVINMLSRTGNEYTELDHIKDQIECLLRYDMEVDFSKYFKITIDGELIYHDDEGDHSLREDGNGIVNKSIKGTITPEEAIKLHLHAWDIINESSDEIHFKVSNNDYTFGQELTKNTEYADRLSLICTMIDKINESNEPYLNKIKTTIVHNIDEARHDFQCYVEQGYEGIVLKNIDSKWKNGRSNDQVKFKEEIMVDLEIVGFIENTKHENTLGSLMLRSKCGKIEVNCGSGFTNTTQFKTKETGEWVEIPLDERPETDRELIWAQRDVLMGSIVEVKCNGLTTDKNRETNSLFLPIFMRFRHDKDEANNLEDVFEI